VCVWKLLGVSLECCRIKSSLTTGVALNATERVRESECVLACVREERCRIECSLTTGPTYNACDSARDIPLPGEIFYYQAEILHH
jgi:hypothetical protein